MARGMEKLPANRYPTTQALIDDLQDFLAARVPINHNARLVMYLREVGAVTDEQAEEILAASAPNRIRRSNADRTLVPQMWAVQGLLFCAVLGGGGAIQAMSGRLSGDPGEFAAESGAPVVPESAGYLRFVVDPWADVYVDGQLVLTTPSAQRVALSPGRHFLRFANPFFESVDREIWVRENEVQMVELTLEDSSAEMTTELPVHVDAEDVHDTPPTPPRERGRE